MVHSCLFFGDADFCGFCVPFFFRYVIFSSRAPGGVESIDVSESADGFFRKPNGLTAGPIKLSGRYR